MYSWLLIDPSEHRYTTQISKFNIPFKPILHYVKQYVHINGLTFSTPKYQRANFGKHEQKFNPAM